MNYSVATSLFMKYDLPTAIGRIADAGFVEVELWTRAPHLDVTDPQYDVRPVLRTLVERGVKATSCHAPFGPHMNLGSPDASVRKAGIESLRSLLEPCAKLGVETIVVHPNVAPQGQTDEQAEATKPLIRESMAIAGDVARPFGLRLAFENMLSAGRSQPCGAMAQLFKLVDGLPDNVGLCFDTGHAFANGLNLASEVRDSGDRLIALHVHNNDGELDRHWPPGRGKIDWPPFLDALRETRFEGAWTLETMARGDEDPIVNLEKTKAAIAAWGSPAGADSP